jgi:hypothetical protein
LAIGGVPSFYGVARAESGPYSIASATDKALLSRDRTGSGGAAREAFQEDCDERS